MAGKVTSRLIVADNGISAETRKEAGSGAAITDSASKLGSCFPDDLCEMKNTHIIYLALAVIWSELVDFVVPAVHGTSHELDWVSRSGYTIGSDVLSTHDQSMLVGAARCQRSSRRGQAIIPREWTSVMLGSVGVVSVQCGILDSVS